MGYDNWRHKHHHLPHFHHHVHPDCGCVKPSKVCEPKPCGCPIKLDTDCVIYTGEKNEVLHIKKGDSLTYLIKMLELLLGEENNTPGIQSFSAPVPVTGEAKRAEFVGMDICMLPEVPNNILAVYLKGLILPSNQYYVDGNEVFIETGDFGNPVGSSDTVIILYN